MDRRGRDMGALALALLALIWGYNWVVMKVGLQYTQPFTFSALRTFLGAASLFALLLVLRRPLRPPPLRWTIAIGLLQTTGFVGLMMWALESGGAGKTSVLTYTMPFWLLLLAWAFLGERLRGVQWLAVALALCGLVLVLEPWRLQGTFSSLLAVAGGLSWACSAVVVKRFQATQRRRHPLSDHLADAVRLAAAGTHRGAHVAGQSGVDPAFAPRSPTTSSSATRWHGCCGCSACGGSRRAPQASPRSRRPSSASRRRGSSWGSGPPRVRPPAWRSSSAPSPSSPPAASSPGGRPPPRAG